MIGLQVRSEVLPAGKQVSRSDVDINSSSASLDVGAMREPFRAGQRQRADIVVGIERPGCDEQFTQHGRVQRIEGLGPVQRDQARPLTAGFDNDVFVKPCVSS